MSIEPPISQSSYGYYGTYSWNTPECNTRTVMEKPYPKCPECGNDSIHPMWAPYSLNTDRAELTCTACAAPFTCNPQDIKWRAR